MHIVFFWNSFTNTITCSHGGCKRTFMYRYALIRHIQKNHVSVDSDEEDFHDDDDGNRVPNNENDANGDNSDAERDDYFLGDFSQETKLLKWWQLVLLEWKLPVVLCNPQ